MKNRVILASVVAFTLVAASVKAQTIAQWTFESQVTTNIVEGAGVSSPLLTPETGTGAANGVHATAATYSFPAGDVDPTLAPSITTSSHSFSANGWSVGDYFQFSTSTLGSSGVQVGWDQTGSNTGPRDFQLSYSLDGGSTFTVPGSTYSLAFFSWIATATLGNNESQTFGGAIDNQASVIFRISDMSTTSINGGAIGVAGTDRVDNFTVFAVPEPSTVALVGAGLIGMLAMRRRRS